MGKLEERLKVAKQELQKWDLQGEIPQLNLDESQSRRECLQLISILSQMRCNEMWQQSREKWLKEGDANSRYFQRCVQQRRKYNEIACVEIKGTRYKEVEETKEPIRRFFQIYGMLGKLQGLQFKKLDNEASLSLP